MKKLYLGTIIFLGILLFSQSAFAGSTSPVTLGATNDETKSVTTNGGNITANINADTGALEATFQPGFTMTSNEGGTKDLKMSFASHTQTTDQNALFVANSQTYVILTNSTVLPPKSAVDNIKTGSPTAASNPNTIAYAVTAPPNQTGILQTKYITSGNYWRLHLSKKGSTNTFVTVPAGLPFTNTFSGDDEAGDYQSTVTLSFV